MGGTGTELAPVPLLGAPSRSGYCGVKMFRLIDNLKNNSYISGLVIRINSQVDNLIGFELSIKFQLCIV